MNRRTPSRRPIFGAFAIGGLVVSSFVGAMPAQAADTPSAPDLLPLLQGYESLWKSSGVNDLHGTVLNEGVMQHDDELTSWINQHATKDQQFRAMQNSAYTNADGSGYDQSVTIADGFGKTLGDIYAEGRMSGKLPLTTALVNSETGTAGAFVSTGVAKKHFSHPRPYLPVDPSAPATAGDTPACAPSIINGSSLAASRIGKPWADAAGNLLITRVAPVVDTTHEFAPGDVALDAQYGQAGICTGGSFPSGHTTSAYQAGLTLATLVPELAPTMLARTSEAGNNRIVLGVHYPLDIIGGRISGEASVAARWSDESFRTSVIEPARQELRDYLTSQCTAKMHVNSLEACIAADTGYTDNPYGGAVIPGGSAQIVTDRASAVNVYTERMSYGFAPTGSTADAAVVPAGASNLLLTTFPTLTDAQRTSVLAQTEIASGNPLAVGDGEGWQRLNLAKAMSATASVAADGSVTVVSTGGSAHVVTAPTPTPSSSTTAPSTTAPSSTSTAPTSPAPSSTAPSTSVSTSPSVPASTSMPTPTSTSSVSTTAPATNGSTPAQPTSTQPTTAPSHSSSTTGPVVQTDGSSSGRGLELTLAGGILALVAGAGGVAASRVRRSRR